MTPARFVHERDVLPSPGCNDHGSPSMKIVTAAQMQALDRRAIQEGAIPGRVLMERAGSQVVERLERRFGTCKGKRILVLCGKGNNGGDGFVAARLLHQRRARVHTLMLASPPELTPDARLMYRRFHQAAGRAAARPFTETTKALVKDADILVDALLGTGLAAEVSGRYRDAIVAINSVPVPVVAVDVPSGIHADTGALLGAAVQADLTVTFGLPKLGLYLGAGIDHAGEVSVADIGIPAAYVDELDSQLRLITEEAAAAALPRRVASAHKGTFGHAGIVAGSVGKTGAAALAATAALRSGAGLVTVAAPASVNDTLESKLLEVMTVPMPETKARTLARSALDRLLAFITARTSVAIGPGISTHPETVELVHALMRRLDRPSVLDADALNALAGRASLLTECKVPPILTPHPGEMARLEPDATPQTVNADRLGIATHFARERGVFLVLKGARSIVARPDGMAAICPTGNPGMATAGTGDVLTGVIAGLLAQGLPPWDAACAGTFFHGYAGDLAAAALGQAGMLAGDLLSRLPDALRAVHRPS